MNKRSRKYSNNNRLLLKSENGMDFAVYRCMQKVRKSETREEQPWHCLQLYQLLMETRSKSVPDGNGTVKQVAASVQQATTLRSFTLPVAKLPRTNLQGSYLENKSSFGRLTKSTAGGWSARSISGTETLRSTSPSGNSLAEFSGGCL